MRAAPMRPEAKPRRRRRRPFLSRIRKGELSDGFTLRDIHQKGWAEPKRPRPGESRPRPAGGPRLVGGEDGTNRRPTARLLHNQPRDAGMSYLDRLRALDAQKHIREQPSKPSKPPFEPFDGDCTERFSPKAVPLSSAPPIVAIAGGFKLRSLRPAQTGPTDQFCSRCGDYAENGWPAPGGGLVWFCSDCLGDRGRLKIN